MLKQSNIQNANSDKPVFAFFISDLHLCVSRPHITEAFIRFLTETAIQAEALYVLGDLFEYWAGDDDLIDPFNLSIAKAFHDLSQQNTKLYLMHGNRDFLMNDAFCQASGMTLLPDPTLVDIKGETYLLSHGDALCTDDADYQVMRQQFRNTDWQHEFLSQPLATRKGIIEQIRLQSEQEKSKKSAMIMDVNADAVSAVLREHAYPKTFIHGHTHRPATHQLIVDDQAITRWVLGDWYEQGSYLTLDQNGLQSSMIP
jgi:UDP-2,3-diacylglucosamine hydrolase